MPTSTTTATAPSRSLGTVDGTEWFISPITEEGWAEYLVWVQDLYMAQQKKHAKGLAPALREKILSEAFARLGRMTLASAEAKPITETPVGVFRLIWLHLKKRHPRVTMDEVAELVNSPAMRERATDLIKQTTEDGTKSKKKQSPKRKKKARVSTRVQRRETSRR